MVDYIKLKLKFKEHIDLDSHPDLDFKQEYSTKTGLIKDSRYAKYYNMKFTIYDSGTILLSGSLHKLYNFLKNENAPNQYNKKQIDKGFNGNDYSYSQLTETILHLSEKFEIDVSLTTIQNIEFGLNMKHNFDTSKILHNLMLHKSKAFDKPLGNSYRQARHSQYYIKCYDKALQYGIKSKLLRFEIKVKKMEVIAKYNIRILSDIIELDKLILIKNHLIFLWEEIVFYDYTLIINDMIQKKKDKCKDYSNPNYWQQLKSNRLDRPRKSYKAILSQYPNNSIQKNMSKIINLKFEEMCKN